MRLTALAVLLTLGTVGCAAKYRGTFVNPADISFRLMERCPIKPDGNLHKSCKVQYVIRKVEAGK